MRDHPLATWVTSVPIRFTYLVCPENEIRATPNGIVDTSGGFAGLVLPLSKCLVNRDSETDRVFLGEGISFLTVRACDGLSWDTPAGFQLSKAVPVVIGRWEFVNVRL